MLKVGFLGTGSMAKTMAKTVRMMPELCPYAVASRTQEKAELFAAENGFQKAYGSYEALVSDPAVELVYIVTPHSDHAASMRLCIDHGKPVLCEKSFTLNAAQARDVLSYAEEKGVFVTEAIWTRYQPMARTIREFAQSGRIGKLTSVSANLAYPVSHRERVRDPKLGGGALLDVGIYTLTFAALALGSRPLSVKADALLSEEGADLQNNILLTYDGGVKVSLSSSIIGSSDRLGTICGTDGYAIVGNVNNYEYLDIYNVSHRFVERIERPQQLTGYEYQFRACIEALRAGKLECPEMPHAETVAMMELMDSIRAQFPLVYPDEERA